MRGPLSDRSQSKPIAASVVVLVVVMGGGGGGGWWWWFVVVVVTLSLFRTSFAASGKASMRALNHSLGNLLLLRGRLGSHR